MRDIDIYFGSPSWVTLGFNSSYAFNQHWKLQGMIGNLFDEHYREFDQEFLLQKKFFPSHYL